MSAVGRACQRRFGRYPGDWIWAALLLLLVAAGSATAGIVSARDTSARSASETVIATSPVVPAPPAPPAVTTTTTTATPTTTTPKPVPKPKPASTLSNWPAKDGYTVVLASIPARGQGKAEAIAKAKAALTQRVRPVGILSSGSFASLHPGYFVVYVGVYDSLDEAQRAARRLTGRYPNAYARQVSR